MSTLYGAGLAALLAIGLMVLGVSFRPKPEKPTSTKVGGDIDVIGWLPWIVAQIVVTLVVWLASGWVALGLGAGALAWVVRLWLLADEERRRYHEVTEAISVWVDMVKDALSSGAGLSQAIESTTKVAPEVIRPEVIRLASTQRTRSQTEALREFGGSLAHPTSDLVTLALVSASESQARDLPALLSKTAEQARTRNEAVLQIETERSQLYAEARAMFLAIAVLGVIIAFLARDFLAPYNSFAGQIVLGLVMALVVGSSALLVQSGRPKPELRLLAVEAEATS